MKTKKQTAAFLIGLALVATFASIGAAAVPERPATKRGWWIRVNSQKTHAATISFEVGMTRNGSQVWRTWDRMQLREFDLPVEFRNARRLYIRATTLPHNKDASFCVFFLNRGVKHFEFDGDTWSQMEPNDSDDECTP
jgi:hypothetical protein